MSLFSHADVLRRIEAIHDFHILDTDAEPEFDHLTQLASAICEAPISTITLLDEGRQWFKSRVGLDVRETPIEQSFCAHVAAQKSVMVVPDATQDSRFATNPLVVDAPGIRYYAGAPLITGQGISIGSLCIVDRVPRELDPHQLVCLSILANKVVELLEVRKTPGDSSMVAIEPAITTYQHANARLNKSLRLIETIAEIVDTSTEADAMLQAALNAICTHTGWAVGHAWMPLVGPLGGNHPEHLWRWSSSTGASIQRNRLESSSREQPSELLNRAMDLSSLTVLPSLIHDVASPHSQYLHRLGFQVGLAVPLVGNQLLGAMEFYTQNSGTPDQAFTDVLQCAGHLLGRALEREAARLTTQRSEAYFRHMTEDSLDIVSILDAEGIIRFESRSAKDDLGWEPEELVGKNAFEFVHPEDAPEALVAFQESLRAEGPTALLCFRFRHKDGSYRVLEGRGNNLLADPAVSGVVFTSRDITEKRRLEAQFGQLAGGIAHDFNNLLTVVVGYSSAAETNPSLDPKLHNALVEIRSAAERAAKLTGQLLAFSGRQILQPRDLALDEQLAESQGPLSILLGESVTIHFAPNAPDAYVHADPIQLDTVLLNLAINARDAMEGSGRIELSTSQVTLVVGDNLPVDLPPGDYCVIHVRDHGCGMAAEVRQRVFEPYFTTKLRGKGTGLGLATCQGIIRQSRGKITVASIPDQGSKFSIYLPQVISRSAQTTLPPVQTTGKKEIRTVLFAEDEEVIRDLGIMVMESTGYRVLSAANGKAALALLDADPSLEIDVLLTDIIMPEMDGKDLAEVVRARLPHVPIIFCSGYAQDSSFYEGLPSGTCLLPKPYTVSAMLAKLTEVLQPPASVP